MLKSIHTHQKDSILKAWTEEARQRSIEARQQRRKEKLGIPKVKEGAKDIYYTRIGDGNFGHSPIAIELNKKIGMLEGIARGYEARIKVLKAGQKDEKGRTKEELIRRSAGLRRGAEEAASQLASHLGRPAKKMMKQDELTEDEIIDMINSGEFDSNIIQEIADEQGIDIEELEEMLNEGGL